MPSVPPPSSNGDRERERTSTPSTPPSKPVKGARPRYLVVALIGAMIFAAGCWTEGCTRLTFYRGEHDMGETLNSAVKNEADRARAETLYKRFTEVADQQRNRAIPLAAAIFVLGAALLAFAARGLAGKTSSRNLLVQLVTAQAVVMALSYYATRDIRNAELDWEFEMQAIQKHEQMPPDQYEQIVPMLKSMRIVLPPTWLLLRTLASGLIVFALTRPRSRDFFEAAKSAAAER